MNFLEALKKMKSGEKINRKNWCKNIFLYLKDEIIFCNENYPFAHFLTVDDYLADNWELHKDKISHRSHKNIGMLK